MNMLSWEWEPRITTNTVDLTRPKQSKTQDMKEYNRIYREKHSSFVECGCGSTFKEISKYTHQHTARHTRWLATLREG
jgi:hypothetical protein